MARGKTKSKTKNDKLIMVIDLKNDFSHLKPKELPYEQWLVLVKAWMNGLSDREAAFRVTVDTGYTLTAKDIQTFKKNNFEIAEMCEMLKDDLKATAKMNVASTLRTGDRDGKMSRWYLEHRCPEEFSTKSAVAFEGQVIGLSLAEKEKALKELVDTFDSDQK